MAHGTEETVAFGLSPAVIDDALVGKCFLVHTSRTFCERAGMFSTP